MPGTAANTLTPNNHTLAKCPPKSISGHLRPPSLCQYGQLRTLTMQELIQAKEPLLLFGYGQAMEDGIPITLKFADAIGEILTAAPLKNVPPLPFSNYI